MHVPTFRSTGSRAIVSGFISVIIIITTLAIGSATYIHYIFMEMEHVVAERNVRIAHLSKMQLIANERALQTQTMLIVRDPFNFDELSTHLSGLLVKFLENRNAILALNLDEHERKLMGMLREQSDSAGRAMQLAAALALEERYDEASNVFYEEGRIRQLKAMDTIHALIEHQHRTNQSILQHAQDEMYDAHILSFIIGLMGIGFSIAIGSNVHRRIANEMQARTKAGLLLHHSEERERVVRENMADVVITVEEDGRITSANNAVECLFGWPATELVGVPFEHCFNAIEESSFPWRKRENNCEANGVIGSEREWLVRRRNGEVFPVSMIITDFHVGYQKEFVAVIRDITKKKEAEQRLRQANRNLECFSYSISHDLQAPLRSIAGFSQILQEDYDEVLDDIGRGYITRVSNAAVRMAEMIDALLGLATLSRTEPRMVPVNLSALAHQHIQMLASSGPGRLVRTDIEPDLIATGDPGLLGVLLQNLLENAWKFTAMRSESYIALGRMQLRGEEIYYVRDNGVGFDTADAGSIFDPFQRLHGNEFEGNGIGLTTVRRIVQQHGGEIWVEGTQHQGACIYFTLQPAWRSAREDGNDLANANTVERTERQVQSVG